MTKQQFVEMYAGKYNVTKKEAKERVETVFDLVSEVVVEDLNDGDRLTIPSFGSFKVKITKERESYNPQTGGKKKIPAKYKVSFTPATSLKEAVKAKKIEE